MPPAKSALDWTPPKKPDPSAILHEAVADRIAGRYRVALAKHVWFHRFALKFEPSLSGVRVSFALRYWKELGDCYPPALRELRRIRNECLENVRHGKRFCFKTFYDLRSINRSLGRNDLTYRVFLELDKTRPRTAKRVYSAVEDILIGLQQFALCSKYIANPIQRIYSILESHDRDRKGVEEGIYNKEIFNTITRHVHSEIAKMIAILAIDDRLEEAHAVAEIVIVQRDESKLRSLIRRSLNGEIPDRTR